MPNPKSRQDPALANILLQRRFLNITATDPSAKDIETTLLMPGADVNLILNNGKSLLWQAIACGNLGVATLLLECDAKLTTLNEQMGEASLLETVLTNPTLSPKKTEDIIRFLHKLGLDLNEPLISAMQTGNIKAATMLINSGADKKCLSERQANGETLLYSLLKKPILSSVDEAVFHFLCDPKNEVDPNIASPDTPLVLLAGSPEKLPLLQPLLQIGANLSWPGVRSHARNCQNTLFINAINKFEAETKHSHEIKQTHEEQEAQERLEIELLIKESGHILGLSDDLVPGDLSTEGNFLFESYHLLQNIINQFYNADSELKRHFAPNAPIQDALSLATQYLEADGKITPQDFIKRHIEGKPVMIPIQWMEKGQKKGHAITLIVWNDILVICNRGDKKLDECISVFEIPSDKMTVEFLEAIMPTKTNIPPDIILTEIQKLVGYAPPILTIPSQIQKHGTCSFVNAKSSILVMLCFIELFEAISQKGEFQFNSTLLKSYIQDGKPLPPLLTAMQNAKIQYKLFTSEMRNFKVKELCNNFKKLAGDSKKLQSIYILLFKAILRQHPGKNKNHEFYLIPSNKDMNSLNDNFQFIRNGSHITIMETKDNQFQIFCRDRQERNIISFICSDNLQKKLLQVFEGNPPPYVTKDQISHDIYELVEEEISTNGGYTHPKNSEKMQSEINRAKIILETLAESKEGKRAIYDLYFDLELFAFDSKILENPWSSLESALTTQDNEAIARILSDNTLDLQKTTIKNETILHIMAKHVLETKGFEDKLLTLVSIINEKDFENNTALTVATRNENWNMVCWLVKQGADWSNPIDGKNILSHAIKARQWELIKLLIGQQPNILQAFEKSNNISLILLAAQNCQWEFIQWLISIAKIQNFQAKDFNHQTVLMYAFQTGSLNIVQALIEQGAHFELEEVNRYGATALMQAASAGQLEIVQWLIAHGANIQATNKEGENALILAANARQWEVFTYLADHSNHNIDIPNARGETPLMLAVNDRKLEIVQFLIERGADPNKANSRGENALTLAVRANAWPIIQWLAEQPKLDLNWNAIVNKKYGTTVLDTLIREGKESILQLIQQKTEVTMHTHVGAAVNPLGYSAPPVINSTHPSSSTHSSQDASPHKPKKSPPSPQ